MEPPKKIAVSAALAKLAGFLCLCSSYLLKFLKLNTRFAKISFEFSNFQHLWLAVEGWNSLSCFKMLVRLNKLRLCLGCFFEGWEGSSVIHR